jgi:SAM-dependent methyltransferase
MEKTHWTPNKAECHRGIWRASRDPREVLVGSRIAADLAITSYAHEITTHARGVLADIGCGKAPYFGIYSPLVSRSIWVDWENSLHANSSLDVTCDLNKEIALADESVDTVLCSDVLEHIYNIGQIWREIARVLRPGGKAIIAVPFLYWVHEAPHDYHRYTLFALRRYAEDVRLEVVSVRALGGWAYVIADLISKRLSRPLLQRPFSAIISPLLETLPKPELTTAYPLSYVMTVQKQSSTASPEAMGENFN